MDHRVQAWEGARHKRHIASKDVPWVSLSHRVRSCNSGVCWTLVPDDSSKESRGKGAWKPDGPSGLALNHPHPFDADHRVQLGRYDVDGPDIRDAHPGGKHEQNPRGRCNAREERRGGQAEGTVASTQPVRKGMRVTKAKDGRRGNPTQGTAEPESLDAIPRDPEPRCHFLQRGSSAAVRGNGHRRNANTRLQALLHPREGYCTPGPCGRWMRMATICALRCRPQTYSNPPSDLAASSSAMGLVGVLSFLFWEAAASAAEGTDPPRICIGCA